MAVISPHVALASLPLLAQGTATMATAISPVLLLLLCVVAGLATVYLLPNRREPAVGSVAGVVLAAVALIAFAALPALRDERGVTGAWTFYFWAFAAIAIAAAVRVVTHPRPVYSALYFVLTVFASAGLFVLLDADFMAAALVIIYAGAILVTYVFVIMLASQAAPEAGHHDGGGAPTDSTAAAGYDRDSREPMVAAALGFTLLGVLLFVVFDRAATVSDAPPVLAAAVNPFAAPPAVPFRLKDADATFAIAQDIGPGTRLATAPVVAAVVPPAGRPRFARTVPVPPPADIPVSGGTQKLGLFLVQSQLVQLEVGAVVLLVSMVGAIVITRRRVVHVPLPGEAPIEIKPEVVETPSTPVEDNPHSIPVYGTDNPRRKAYPQT